MIEIRKLQDLTLEELWGVFPIVLTPHNNQWQEWATEEMESLAALLERYNPVISHIGSTAIPAFKAKPIIDILVEINYENNQQRIKEEMETAGYICMSVSEIRMSFNKGYTLHGYDDKVFHVHFHTVGDNDEIRFRDYLLTHPDVAGEYERLKLSLLPKYRNDRDGYTSAKSGFIKRITDMAKSEGKNR